MKEQNADSKPQDGGAEGEQNALGKLLGNNKNDQRFIEMLNSCADDMRKDLEKIFNPEHTATLTSKVAANGQESTEDGDSAIDAAASGADASVEDNVEVDTEKTPKTSIEKRMKQIDSKDIQDVKMELLQHFDTWKDKALSRITGEIQQESESQSHRNISGSTSIEEMEDSSRALLLHSCLLLLLGLEKYSAESRTFLARLADVLRLNRRVLIEDEKKVAQGLLHAAEQEMNADGETEKRAHDKAVSRRWKIGLGTAAGAALIGVTGGLAAPLLAAGVGSVMGGVGLGSTAVATYLGAMAGSAPLVGALFGAYGGKMAGEIVQSYAKEVNDFAFIPVRKSTFNRSASTRRLRVAIGVAGWLSEPSDVVKPWHIVGSQGAESFALRWEMDVLLNLGNSLTTYAKSAAWGAAKSEIISHTVFAALSSALWPLGIAKAARVIDNPFSVAIQRSTKAGKVLADALINRVQGERPVTLLGYSLGARVVVACLEELAFRKAFGLVEKVVLAGAAVSSDGKIWRRIRSVVSGRVVNAYSTQDYMLAFLFRTHNLKAGVAGLQPVEDVFGVENVDVSAIVKSHFEYRFMTGQVMQMVGLDDIDEEAVERQIVERKDAQAEVENEQAEQEARAKGKNMDPEEEANQMEQSIAAKNKEAAKDWMGRRVTDMKDLSTGIKDKFSQMTMKGKSSEDQEQSNKSAATNHDSDFNIDVSTNADKQGSSGAGKSSKAIGSTLGGIGPGLV